MKELTKAQLEDLIVTLEAELFTLHRNAEIHGVLDGRLISVREILGMARKELGNR